MRRLAKTIPYFNKPITRKRSKAQSLIEFAFISMILFAIILGSMEMARLMFIWTQLSSAAQEGARWGIVHPLQVISNADDCGNPSCYAYPYIEHTPDDTPCNIVKQARARVSLIDPSLVTVFVSYDGGADGTPQTHPIPSGPGGQAQFTPYTDRVIVSAHYPFHFLVGILDRFIPNGLDVQMTSARTILQDEPVQPVTYSCPEFSP